MKSPMEDPVAQELADLDLNVFDPASFVGKCFSYSDPALLKLQSRIAPQHPYYPILRAELDRRQSDSAGLKAEKRHQESLGQSRASYRLAWLAILISIISTAIAVFAVFWKKPW